MTPNQPSYVPVGPILFLVDNQLVNRTFWCTLILSVTYYLLVVLVDKCTQSERRRASSTAGSPPVQPYKWRPTTSFVWSISYYLVSAVCLLYYHAHFVQPDVDRADSRYFPQYENLLFIRSSDCNRNHFKNIFVVTVAFHLLGIVLQVREAEYTDAITRILFTTVLAFFYNLRFEHFFLMLHITVGLYQALTYVLLLVALHTNRTQHMVFNVCAGLHFLSWSYVFLTLLPFNYLLPTLYMKPFNAWLNVFCWLWYGSCVWNSPVLQVLYHQKFHTLATDCLGECRVGRVARRVGRVTNEVCLYRWWQCVPVFAAKGDKRHKTPQVVAQDSRGVESGTAVSFVYCVYSSALIML